MFQIGTRGSKLATTQAGHVRDWLIDAGFDSQLHIVTTAGDVNTQVGMASHIYLVTRSMEDEYF